MKAAAITGALVAALAVGAVATPTFAQPYRAAYENDCRQRNDGAAGTVIGGIAGALIGSNLASHHGGRAGGAALGAVAGALLGNTISRSSSSSCGYSSQAYYDTSDRGGYARSYDSYGSGYAYRQNNDRGYDNRYSNGRYGQTTYSYQPYGGYDRGYRHY
jgi:uncharacterized protein YcfJ